MTHTVMGLNRPKSNLGYAPRLFRNPSHVPPSLFAYKSRALDHPILGSKGLKFGPIPNAKKYVFSPIPDIFFFLFSIYILYNTNTVLTYCHIFTISQNNRIQSHCVLSLPFLIVPFLHVKLQDSIQSL